MNDIQAHKIKKILKESIIPYLEENVEAAIDNCGKDDDIVTKPAINVRDSARAILKILEVSS